MGRQRRKVLLNEIYKRVKHTLLYDPDLTDADLKRRFGISDRKAVDIRKEVEEEQRADKKT